MKAADIKVGEVYAAHRSGGDYGRRNAYLVKIIGKDESDAPAWRGQRKPPPGWLVERVEDDKWAHGTHGATGERLVIPSHRIFHDKATELALRARRRARQSEHAERLAEGQRLARVIGGTVLSAVGGFTISLTPEEARALSARIREEES